MNCVSHNIFFPGSRQEVNISWYPEIEEPIKSCGKHYSLVLYILISFIEFAPDQHYSSEFRATLLWWFLLLLLLVIQEEYSATE